MIDLNEIGRVVYEEASSQDDRRVEIAGHLQDAFNEIERLRAALRTLIGNPRDVYIGTLHKRIHVDFTPEQYDGLTALAWPSESSAGGDDGR